MRDQLQEHLHCHWGAKHAQQPAKTGGPRTPIYNAITHMHRQKMASGKKKYHFYLSLRKVEQPFSFF